MRIYFYHIHCVALLGLLLPVAGCVESQPREKTEVTVKQSLAVNHEQMRLRMRGLAEAMCGQVQQSADAIIAGTRDRDVQLAALTWKMEAVPALREALFLPNAFAVALDTMGAPATTGGCRSPFSIASKGDRAWWRHWTDHLQA